MMARAIICGVAILLFMSPKSSAQSKAKLAREAVEFVAHKFGREAVVEGVTTLTRKVEVLAIKHGDEAFLAVRKVGPRTLLIVEEAGEHGLQSVKLMAKYGDDAIWIASKPNRMTIFVNLGDDA